MTAPVIQVWLTKDPVICTRPVSKRSAGQSAQSARAGTREIVATPEYWPASLVLILAGKGEPVITCRYWLWLLRLCCSMERALVVRWVSQTATTSVSTPARSTLFPCNPDGLHTPRDHWAAVVAGPGVLASPMRHSVPKNRQRKRKILVKNPGTRKLWFTTDRVVVLWLPDRHS